MEHHFYLEIVDTNSQILSCKLLNTHFYMFLRHPTLPPYATPLHCKYLLICLPLLLDSTPLESRDQLCTFDFQNLVHSPACKRQQELHVELIKFENASKYILCKVKILF